MAMENLEVVNTKFESRCDDSMPFSDDVRKSENLDVDFLADLDSYWQDINDRLTISRMVSDSIIKGMVTAVSQEAAEKIAQKELEVAGLREMLHVLGVGVDEKETLASLESKGESNSTSGRSHCSFLETVTEHERMRETLGSLRSVSKAEFAKLKKEINRNRGCNSMKRISSGSELLGLGGILHEQSSERWSDSDKAVESLKMTIETVFKGVEEIVQSTEESLQEWKQEQEFQAEIEALVMGSCIRSVVKEFEGKLWDRICGDKSTNWSVRVTEISSLREELDSLSKFLCVPEAGQLISHGSLDSEGWTNGKKSHFHHKVLGNHVALSPSLCEENGKHEEPQNNKLENLDPYHLGHLDKDDLIAYYLNEITKLKRNHESKVQEMTEEYFSLKREYLREKRSSLLLKDKEFNTLRKKIPEIISKLEDIILENEKIHASNNAGSLSSLKERLETLIAENRQLRGSLTEKKKEVKCLATQVSDATERMSQHSLSETKLLNSIRCLKSSIQDLQIEASIGSDVFNCVLREMTGQIKRTLEDSCAEYNLMQQHYESIIKEASQNAQDASKREVNDSDMLSIIMQGLFEVIFRESWQEAKDKLDILTKKCIDENEVRVSLEKEVLAKERILEIELAEKEGLKQEILFLAEEKEQLAHDAAAALQSEKERYHLAVIQKQNEMSLREENEKEFRKQMNSMAVLVQGLSKATMDFECRVTKAISKNCLRLKNLNSQSCLLTQKANIQRRTGVLYKQRLERRNTDLQKAENEVDLLGDEVDNLLSILEKVYIGLDHYSPILQHYPGIIEILKLVKMELGGESARSV